ncbi:MAG: glycosyltransferase family 2 protein [Litorilinea sp.]
MHIAIVIVSYNTCDHLRRCLQSIQAHTVLSGTVPDDTVPDSSTKGDANIESVRVIVVDNASHDGSAAMVAAEFPHVQLIAADRNLGFTGGNNRALHQLGFTAAPAAVRKSARVTSQNTTTTAPTYPRPDYVWLLNPDTEITPGALETLLAFMESAPHAAVCGPQLCYGDGTFQHAAFAFPDWQQVVLDLAPVPILPGIRRIWTRLLHSGINGRYPARQWQGTDPFPVDFVLGAAMLVRGSAIDAVGALDDTFFMYCEEMDWCLRMAHAGWGIYAVPRAQVIHHEAQSSRQVRHATTVRLWRSRLYFMRKHTQLYSPTQRRAIHSLARLYWAAGRVRAWRAFRHGQLTGLEMQRELDAFCTLFSL